jgi:hypothetical protein
MNLQSTGCGRVLCLHAAAKRLQMPERTLRYQASRGRIQGAFKEGKLWKFSLAALETTRSRRSAALVGLCQEWVQDPPAFPANSA